MNYIKFKMEGDFIMEKRMDNTLSGKNNKRLDKVKSTNNEGTAAWANEESTLNTSNVSMPGEYEVEKAKNWVDNGSKL
jgi:hypothetical protein